MTSLKATAIQVVLLVAIASALVPGCAGLADADTAEGGIDTAEEVRGIDWRGPTATIVSLNFF